MKGLIAIFTLALFLTSAVIAQHVDVVNQAGNNNSSTVEQSFLTPSGPGLPANEAYVDQIGDDNTSEVNQLNGGFAGDGNWAKVYTSGNANVVDVFQERSAGDADVYQAGDNNRIEIFQSGNFYKSTIFTPGIDASAYSIGNANIIIETMWGTNATAFSWQQGNENRIDQIMGSDNGEKVENSDFVASQVGDRNIAYQLMDGEGWAGGISALDNTGTIFTTGSDNYARQLMLEGGFPAAANNDAYASQNGNNNYSDQEQTGAGNSSVHTQAGNNNTSVTIQN